jgi:hypothetical protein
MKGGYYHRPMRRGLAFGILLCLLLSYIPAIPDDIEIEIIDQVIPEPSPNLIPEEDMTLAQVGALNAVGWGRGASSNWSSVGGSADDDRIYEMTFDSQGNIIVCGMIYQVSQFGSIQVHTEGEGDILMAKLDTAGVWQWAISAGTALYYDQCWGVTVDSNDNVYGTGYFRGSVTFGNTTLTTTGYDGWVARVNSTGEFDWAIKFGGFDVDIGWAIAADNYDNLYVSGYYQNFTEFDSTQLNAEGMSENYRFFLAYYNTSSELWVWAKDSYGSGVAAPYALVHEPSTNDVYVAGYNSGSESFNGQFTSNPQSTWAGILLKYNDAGGLRWGRNIAGPQCPLASNCGVWFNSIALHPNGGVVVGGNFLLYYKDTTGVTHTGVGSWDPLVAYYNQSGGQQWVFTAGSNQDDTIYAISVNLKGEVQFGGKFHTAIQFPNYVLNKSSSTTEYDAYIVSLNETGKFQWATAFGGAGNDTVRALLTLSDGSIIAGGDFSGTVNFGNIPKSATNQDVFVWKFVHDMDDDGILDYVDNCLKIANSNQSNYDGDLRGDACETDDDNDGLHDVLDDCQYGMMNWNQSNISLDHDQDGCRDIDEDFDDDADGYNDSEDNCPSGIIDWVPDAINDLDQDGCRDEDEDLDDDDDSILDVDDNCQYLANFNQSNYDEDSQGDICDPDDDGDTVVDSLDDCPMGSRNWTSAVQTDKDGDGCEDEGSNEDLDDDNDGILDIDDQCPRGETDWNSSSNTDRDGDGCRNDNEDNDNDNDSLINEVDLCPNGISNWRKNQTNDNDGDGCLDAREDNDDDNDNFSDAIDFCPNQEGTATLGGMRGCPDFDSDGWADAADSFFQDPTQWNDGDADGFGDNPSGNNPDACPFFFGNSSADRSGCIDSDGDGYSDPDLVWLALHGADAFIDEPTQWSDLDGDGYGDNFEGLNVDFCTDDAGTSTIDRYGCPDFDGDGYSDPDAFWTDSRWDSDVGVGPDMFFDNPTQWFDTDGDLFGDNWGIEEWNGSRDSEWPGMFIEGAYQADMCPIEAPNGLFDDEINYPGCLLTGESDGGKDPATVDTSKGESNGFGTMTIIGIIGGLVVLALVGVVVILLRKKSVPKKKEVTPSVTIEEVDNTDQNTVESWEELPTGDYIDPDESGTNWFKADNGDHWFQNTDGTWSKWTG